MAQRRKIHPERVLTVISAFLFVLCIIYGAYLYIDMSDLLSFDDHAISERAFVELGYSEDEAKELALLDEELKSTIIQYPINSISYELALADGMNSEDYVHGQELYERFDHLTIRDVEAMLEKRGEEDPDNIFQNDRYYIASNQERYEALASTLNEENYISEEAYIRSVVELVNSEMDTIDYVDYVEADTSKDQTMLVNKHHVLDQNYVPDNLVEIDANYGRGELRSDILEDLYQMMDDCVNSKEDMSLFVTSPYRSYVTQENLYNNYVYSYGQQEADTFSARPGFSEHQSGLAVDIVAYEGQALGDFAYYEECEWLKSHASEYGFILRYPDGKEDVTGYQSEPWHYRYVGKEISTHYASLDITFDEYYAFYLS